MENKDTIMVRVPTQLKKELQIIAIQQDTNMSDIIRPLIEDYVRQHKP